MGHKIHHLYLWHISDKMGVLKHVLHVLSTDVACDGDIPHQSTQQVQQSRRNKDDEHERRERKAFRVAVGSSLGALAIAAKEKALRREEDKVERFLLSAMEAEDAGDERKTKFYEANANKHRKRVSQYIKEIDAMKTQSPVLSPLKDVNSSSKKRRRDA